MLDLESTKWSELSHAYGKASDIPDLLSQLVTIDPKVFDKDQSKPWFSLWSALCHQGDIYPATFAAVPHIVRIAWELSVIPHWQFFAFPATVEIQRQKQKMLEIPEELAVDYFAALQDLHRLAFKIADQEWDELLSQSITAALLVSKGHWLLADTIFEMTQENIREFRKYLELDEEDESTPI